MPVDEVGAVRAWLRTCPALAGAERFGVDHLGDAPGDCALFALPGEEKCREDILGQTRLLPRQSRAFALALRGAWGAEVRCNLENLERLRAVAEWMRGQSEAGCFPEWGAGAVTAVVPAIGAAAEFGDGTARYELRFRVEYRTE